MADEINPGRSSFPPPTVPTKVQCIQCGRIYESYMIQFVSADHDNKLGTWHCPTAECPGVGFLFDIWPTDPNWIDEQGNKMCREEEGPDLGLDEDDLPDGLA